MTKSRLELLDQEDVLKQKLSDLINSAEKEERKLNDTEDTAFKKLQIELTEVRNQLNQLDQFKTLNTIKSNKTMEKRNFSILKAINESLANSYSEETRAVIEAGKEEMQKAGQSYKGSIILPMEERAIQITGDGSTGGVAKVVEKTNILAPLRDKLVLVQAGASMLTNLTGDVAVPSYSGSNVTWEGEVNSAKDGKGTFSEVVLKPKRLTAILDVSKQFLIQDSVSAEDMLRNDLVKAVAEKLEQTILGKHATNVNMPDGFFTTVPTNKGAVSFERIVGMEADVEAANASGNAYIIHPKVKAKLKTTPKAANSITGFIYESDTVNGYPVYSTNAIAQGLQTGADEYGVLFGNFNDLVIGQWGALDITVDPYTKAGDGQVRLVINAYFDAKPRRTGTIVAASMK